MKVYSKADGDQLASKLASHVKLNRIKTRVVAADDRASIKEEAKQSAIMYWIMGWTWEEIECILEDSEYPDKVISYAMDQAKAYAKEVLNKGPFAMFDDQQRMKLRNGAWGKLAAKYQDHVDLMVGDSKIKVAAELIDVDASAQLKKAHQLRKQAQDKLSGLKDPLSPEGLVKRASTYASGNPTSSAQSKIDSVLRQCSASAAVIDSLRPKLLSCQAYLQEAKIEDASTKSYLFAAASEGMRVADLAKASIEDGLLTILKFFSDAVAEHNLELSQEVTAALDTEIPEKIEKLNSRIALLDELVNRINATSGSAAASLWNKFQANVVIPIEEEFVTKLPAVIISLKQALDRQMGNLEKRRVNAALSQYNRS